MSELGSSFLKRLNRVLGSKISCGLHEPVFTGREWDYVRDCLDTGWVSTAGAYVGRFEKELAQQTGAAEVVAVVNGTAALHLALEVAGVEAGDEVLIPAVSFVATANAVCHAGAVPHFVEIERPTLGMDPEALAYYLTDILRPSVHGMRNRLTGRRVSAVVPMHTFGHPVRMEPLLELANRFQLAVVEDAAEALGSMRGNRHAGTFGRVGTLSFNGNKTITTGGGGALLTNDPALAARARHLATTAKVGNPWIPDHDAVAYNYRMPNLNAALGCAQLEQLSGFLEAKRALAGRFAAAFEDFEGGVFVREPDGCRSNYWLNALILERASDRDELLRVANEAGCGVRACWKPLPDLPMYREVPTMPLTVARDLAGRILNLPSGAGLSSP